MGRGSCGIYEFLCTYKDTTITGLDGLHGMESRTIYYTSSQENELVQAFMRLLCVCDV